MDQELTSSAQATSGSSGTQSIGRALVLLKSVAVSGASGVSLTELVETAGLAKPTCRRILIALIDAGLAEQNPISRRYYLGPAASQLATLAGDRFGMHRLALDGVERLARETGDAAFIQVRREWSVVCLHRADGAYPIRSHVLATGDRNPLGAGAAGIALLAALPDADVARAIDANAEVLASKYPVLTPARLRDLVAEARQLGYGFNRGLLFPGSWGIGMVVRDAQGRPDGCLSLAAIESRFQADRAPAAVALLRREVGILEARLRERARSDDTATTRGSRATGAGTQRAAKRRAIRDGQYDER